MQKKIAIDTIIFDFDSTILKGELLEILANFKLKDNPQKDSVLAEIKAITNLGMEGRIPFEESLERRLKILELDEDTLIRALPEVSSLISEQYVDLIPNIKGKKIFIISGGYKNIIDELSPKLSVSKKNIFAIDLYFQSGRFIGFARSNPLVKSDGKATVANSISGRGRTLMVGDGMTDYLVKELGGADYFAAYTGVVKREVVCAKADFVLDDLRDLTKYIA